MKEPYTRVPNSVLRSRVLTPYDKLVFAMIVSCGAKAFPSYATLQEWTGLSKDRIWKSLKSLEEKNLIRRFKREGDQRIHYATYLTEYECKTYGVGHVQFGERKGGDMSDDDIPF